jgi:arginine/lysine/ornithine decarboxylase
MNAMKHLRFSFRYLPYLISYSFLLAFSIEKSYNMNMMPSNVLRSNLISLKESDFYPFHMPGHKRTPLPFPNPWTVDITELSGFDDLHHPKGLLKELQERAAVLFGAKESFCMVNGSNCGVLTAISACVKRGGKFLMARNSHRSA